MLQLKTQTELDEMIFTLRIRSRWNFFISRFVNIWEENSLLSFRMQNSNVPKYVSLLKKFVSTLH